MQNFSFSKDSRLRKQSEIRAVFQDGAFQQLGLLGSKYKPTPLGHCRFLISIRKTVGHAPERNRIKRLIREASRLNKNSLKTNYDICFFVKNSPKKRVTFDYINQKIAKMFAELNRKQP